MGGGFQARGLGLRLGVWGFMVLVVRFKPTLSPKPLHYIFGMGFKLKLYLRLT